MTRYERHPAPEKLILQITTEAVNLLALGTPDKPADVSLPDEQLLECYDGPMTAELIWGLFETAVRLDDAQERATIHQLALLLADALDFDEWLERNGPVEAADK